MATLETLARHGYWILFLLVLAERFGLPLPAIPILVGAGALVRAGSMQGPATLLLAVAASLIADLGWYLLGRKRGGSVMRWLCRISLEPDSCVRRTEDAFARLGGGSLLFAKFVGPLSAAAVPMAGLLGMPLSRFLLLDLIGSVLWVGTFLSLGYAFHDEIERLLENLGLVGAGLVAAVLAALVLYVGWRWWRRQRFLHRLRVARITPEALRARLDAGEEMTIVDLRHALEFASDPEGIPGALHIPVEEFEARHAELPRDRELILYCT